MPGSGKSVGPSRGVTERPAATDLSGIAKLNIVQFFAGAECALFEKPQGILFGLPGFAPKPRSVDVESDAIAGSDLQHLLVSRAVPEVRNHLRVDGWLAE